MLDKTTEFGRRVANRLETELVIWFTTVRSDGMPQPVPVWFLWENEEFLIYTKPNAFKLRNIWRNPKVSLHFNGDDRGGNIIIVPGEAYLDKEAPMADQVENYIEKYRQRMAFLEYTAESFARSYSVPIKVKPTRFYGH